MTTKFKVTRVIEFEGELEVVTRQLENSLDPGEHLFSAGLVVRVGKAQIEPVTQASTAAFDAVKSFCRST